MFVQSNLTQKKIPAVPIVSFDFSTGVQVEVVFGSPAKNCQGAGICMIIDAARIPPDRFPCPHASAQLYVSSAGRPVLRFEKSGFLNNRAQQRVRAPFFTVEEIFRVPAFLLRRAGWRSAFFIVPGKYPVVEYENAVEIFF